MLITLQLESEKILRVLQAVKRDSDALISEIESQANSQIVGAALAPPPPAQPDVAGLMASASAPEFGFAGRMASASELFPNEHTSEI